MNKSAHDINALKGRGEKAIYGALSGRRKIWRFPNPGRCLGLSYAAPLVRSKSLLNKKLVLVLFAGVASILCSGCGKQAFDRQRYALMVQRPDLPTPVKTQAMLEVRSFSIDAAFASRSLTYRRTEHRFETDFYHEYMAGLGEMMADQMRRWLDRSGMFSAVFSSGSLLRPTYVVEGNIAAAYLDTSEAGSPAARLEITLWLLQTDTPKATLVFGKSYRARQAVKTAEAEAYINAQRECLAMILMDFENDLATLANATELEQQSTTPNKNRPGQGI